MSRSQNTAQGVRVSESDGRQVAQLECALLDYPTACEVLGLDRTTEAMDMTTWQWTRT